MRREYTRIIRKNWARVRRRDRLGYEGRQTIVMRGDMLEL